MATKLLSHVDMNRLPAGPILQRLWHWFWHHSLQSAMGAATQWPLLLLGILLCRHVNADSCTGSCRWICIVVREFDQNRMRWQCFATNQAGRFRTRFRSNNVFLHGLRHDACFTSCFLRVISFALLMIWVFSVMKLILLSPAIRTSNGWRLPWTFSSTRPRRHCFRLAHI